MDKVDYILYHRMRPENLTSHFSNHFVCIQNHWVFKMCPCIPTQLQYWPVHVVDSSKSAVKYAKINAFGRHATL